jgi:hypothetical protein
MKSLGIQKHDPPGRQSGYFACQLMAIGLLDRRLVEALNSPAAFQSALVDKNPMTRQHRPWRPTQARGVATTRHIVIAMRSLMPMWRRTLWLKKPEFCECLEHRSPPFPLCAAGQ